MPGRRGSRDCGLGDSRLAPALLGIRHGLERQPAEQFLAGRNRQVPDTFPVRSRDGRDPAEILRVFLIPFHTIYLGLLSVYMGPLSNFRLDYLRDRLFAPEKVPRRDFGPIKLGRAIETMLCYLRCDKAHCRVTDRRPIGFGNPHGFYICKCPPCLFVANVY